MEKRRFTREELYELVWSKPMRKLGEEFGISDVGLAKICDRNQIPTPPRGYWARREAGQRVRQPPLPAPTGHLPMQIEVSGALSQLPPSARDIVSKAKEAKSSNRPAVFPPPNTPPHRLHSVVQATARALRNSKSGDDGLVHATGDSHCGAVVGKASAERVICFLDALFRLVDEHALNIEATGRATRISEGKDTLNFAIVERTKRVKHVPTQKETAAEERRLVRRRRYWQPQQLADDIDFDFTGPAFPEFDEICTGELVCQVEGFDPGIRRSWGDGKTQTLESMIDDIVAGFKVLLATRKVRREQSEERQRKLEELRRRHELARGRVERDNHRVEFLQLIASQQAEASRLRAFLASMPADAATDELVRFVLWVQARLREIERS